MLKKIASAASSVVNRAVYGRAPEGGPTSMSSIPFTRLGRHAAPG